MNEMIDLSPLPRLLSVAVFSTIGALACRMFADKGDPMTAFIGFAAYGVSTWLWIGVLRGASLGLAVTVNAILTTILLTLIGHYAFGDDLRAPQFVGMGLGAASVFFFSIKAG